MGTELGAMVEVDQALRAHVVREMPAPGAKPPRIVEQLALVDRANTKKLRELLRECGWPKQSVHGEKAANDAWLLAQHADHDVEFQESALRLLEARVKEGEAGAEQYAYLADRLATARGKPQLYGTQLKIVGECELELERVDSLEKVEDRRRSLGMQSLAEYRALVLQHAMPAHCSGSTQ